MKHKFILILSVILLFSCGDDDSASSSNTDALIGQWKIVQRLINGTQSALEQCEPFNMYTYNENGTYLELLYAADEDSECLDNPSIEVNGTWQKINATTYSFTTSNNETSELIIEFNSNDTFQITFSTFSNPNDPAIQTIIETYNRIE